MIKLLIIIALSCVILGEVSYIAHLSAKADCERDGGLYMSGNLHYFCIDFRHIK